MFRVANILMVGALLVTAAVVYQLKYASTAEAERLATLRSQIRKERDAIAVMRAEWARRTSPFYIQGLVERHLDLKRLDVESISEFDDLPRVETQRIGVLATVGAEQTGAHVSPPPLRVWPPSRCVPRSAGTSFPAGTAECGCRSQ